MRFLTAILVPLCLFSTAYGAEKAKFYFYRVYEVTAENEGHLKLYQEISDNPNGYTFMSNAPANIGSTAQLIVPPHKFGEWSELVEELKLKTQLVTNNLQDDIDSEESAYRTRKVDYDFNNFQRFNETYAWMRDLASSSAGVSTFMVGKSFEGRDILGLRINVGNEVSKKSIVIEGTIHANEWIGGSTAIYIINELLTSNDPNVKALLNRFDWWFVPILNVDGYEHTWNSDRTWRKTRRPTTSQLCRGADPNRNWNIMWGAFGGSTNPCSSSYYGDFAFSEPEIKQFAEFLYTVPNFFTYISFHSFGRLLMTPYAFSRDNISNLDVINAIGTRALQSIAESRGSAYRLGKVSDFFGIVAGSSVDYVVVNQKPVLSYCYELSNRHILPNTEIQLVGREVFASIVTILNEAIIREIA